MFAVCAFDTPRGGACSRSENNLAGIVNGPPITLPSASRDRRGKIILTVRDKSSWSLEGATVSVTNLSRNDKQGMVSFFLSPFFFFFFFHFVL